MELSLYVLNINEPMVYQSVHFSFIRHKTTCNGFCSVTVMYLI